MNSKKKKYNHVESVVKQFVIEDKRRHLQQSKPEQIMERLEPIPEDNEMMDAEIASQMKNA